MRLWLPLLFVFCADGGCGQILETRRDPAVPHGFGKRTSSLVSAKAGRVSPRGSEHRVAGDLVEADFIHRSGQFRSSVTGELVDFALLPYAVIKYLDAEADLRDLPLGTAL